MLSRTDSTNLPAQTNAAQLERDELEGAHARLWGLAHLTDSLGPQLDLHLHSMWPAGSTAPEQLFLPASMPGRDGAPLRHPRKTQGQVSLASYKGTLTDLILNGALLDLVRVAGSVMYLDSHSTLFRNYQTIIIME